MATQPAGSFSRVSLLIYTRCLRVLALNLLFLVRHKELWL